MATHQIGSTEANLIAELLNRVNSESKRHGMTVAEIADNLGWSRDRVRGELVKLNNAGELIVRRVPIIGINGKRAYTYEYTINSNQNA